VREFNTLNENFKAVQAENYQLRDYIITLQSRLLESPGEFPQPPSNINIQNPRVSAHPPSEQGRAPTAPMTTLQDELQASAAQAVAEHKHRSDDASYTHASGPNKRVRLDDNSTSHPPNGVQSAEYKPLGS